MPDNLLVSLYLDSKHCTLLTSPKLSHVDNGDCLFAKLSSLEIAARRNPQRWLQTLRKQPAECVMQHLFQHRVEMLARIFALGFWRGDTAYLRDNYNRLDFLVVLSSWALKIVAWTHIYQPIYPGQPSLRMHSILLYRNRNAYLKEAALQCDVCVYIAFSL